MPPLMREPRHHTGVIASPGAAGQWLAKDRGPWKMRSATQRAGDQAVDVVFGVVDVEAGAGGGDHAEAGHQAAGRSGGRPGRRRSRSSRMLATSWG